MRARAAGALLICSVLISTNVRGKSLQNFDGSLNEFNLQRYFLQHANIIGFNNQNRPFPHSVNNFNPLSSSLVSSSHSVFRPGFSNRNSYPSSVFFGRPLPINQFHGRRVPRIPAAQTSGISFNNNRGQQGGALNAGAITFGRPVNTPVSFSNKPTQTVLPSHSSNVPRIPISFGGGPILFPGSSTDLAVPQTTDVNLVPSPTEPAGGASVTESNIPNINEDGNCMLKHGAVYFNGNCEILLSRASCPEDHWLLIDATGSPYCAERRCPWGKLNHLGDCVDPGDNKVCNLGQILYVDLTGLAECDCETDFVFDPTSGNCYGIHEQGFCEDTKHLERDPEGSVICVSNPCVSDKYVEQDSVCYEKNYRGYCPQDQVMILPQHITADCLFIVPHSIFEVPVLNACPRGSRRDFLNQCRGELRIPSQSTFPSSRGDCRPDFVKDNQGTCRKVINLFG